MVARKTSHKKSPMRTSPEAKLMTAKGRGKKGIFSALEKAVLPKTGPKTRSSVAKDLVVKTEEFIAKVPKAILSMPVALVKNLLPAKGKEKKSPMNNLVRGVGLVSNEKKSSPSIKIVKKLEKAALSVPNKVLKVAQKLEGLPEKVIKRKKSPARKY